MRGVTAVLALAVVLGCASTGDPPGGPPDPDPPVLMGVEPESGAVLTQPPGEVNILFDEVISERIAAPRPHIAGAVLLSPAVGEVRVRWHRDRISVRPREGFGRDRVYRLELFPVITDLRQNRLRAGRIVVFSTGPAIPDARLSGALVDWIAGRPAALGLIEALLLPDSLPYRFLTDSLGSFDAMNLPAGEYLVYGVVDQDGDRRRGPREAFDTVRIRLDSVLTVQLFAFAHDTIAPRLRAVESVDSVTIRLTFDRPLDPDLQLLPGMVRVTRSDDTTSLVGVLDVLTQQLDSLRGEEAAIRDTTRGPDREQAAPARAVPPPPLAPQAAARGARRDSTPAERMLARRPPPTDTRLVRLSGPLAADTRYVVSVDGVRGLTGVTGSARAQFRLPRPRTETTTRRPAAAGPRPDTAVTRPAPPADTLVPARRP